jgi:hypothetical protein
MTDGAVIRCQLKLAFVAPARQKLWIQTVLHRHIHGLPAIVEVGELGSLIFVKVVYIISKIAWIWISVHVNDGTVIGDVIEIGGWPVHDGYG